VQDAPRGQRATTLGFLSILLWGTSIAVGRYAIGQVGFLRGPMIMSLASGVIGSVFIFARRRERAGLRTLPPSYWVVCGGLFVLYSVAYNLGIGLARDGRQILVFGMLNYLWPVLTVVFSTLIFKRRASVWLGLGILAALAGIVLAFLSRPSSEPVLSFRAVLADIAADPVVYLLGLLCGAAWGLYSNLGRKMVGDHEANPVPVLFLATGAVFSVLFLSGAFPGAGAGRAGAMSAAGIATMAYRAVFVDLLAYALWDAAMRRGDQILVAAISFLTPLLSTACITLVLGVRPGPLFWTACLLLTAGAAVSRASVRDERNARDIAQI
jgi:drug/metabolite transporter (DMT)-like permease